MTEEDKKRDEFVRHVFLSAMKELELLPNGSPALKAIAVSSRGIPIPGSLIALFIKTWDYKKAKTKTANAQRAVESTLPTAHTGSDWSIFFSKAIILYAVETYHCFQNQFQALKSEDGNEYGDMRILGEFLGKCFIQRIGETKESVPKEHKGAISKLDKPVRVDNLVYRMTTKLEGYMGNNLQMISDGKVDNISAYDFFRQPTPIFYFPDSQNYYTKEEAKSVKILEYRRSLISERESKGKEKYPFPPPPSTQKSKTVPSSIDTGLEKIVASDYFTLEFSPEEGNKEVERLFKTFQRYPEFKEIHEIWISRTQDEICENTAKILEKLEKREERTWKFPAVERTNQFFTGRENILKTLVEKLQNAQLQSKAENSPPAPIVLRGMSGIGKSETALKAAERYKEEMMSHHNQDIQVVRINSQDFQALSKSFRALAKSLKLIDSIFIKMSPSEIEELSQEIYNFCEAKKISSLFIFDNVEVIKQTRSNNNSGFAISPYLPSADYAGYSPLVLITTNKRGGAQFHDSVFIETGLSLDETTEFFRVYFAPSTSKTVETQNESSEGPQSQVEQNYDEIITEDVREEIAQLYKIVDGYPLALQLIASNIKASRKRKTLAKKIEEFRSLLEKNDYKAEKQWVTIKDEYELTNSYKKIMLNVFQSSINSVTRTKNGEVGLNLLVFLAYLNPDAITVRHCCLLHALAMNMTNEDTGIGKPIKFAKDVNRYLLLLDSNWTTEPDKISDVYREETFNVLEVFQNLSLISFPKGDFPAPSDFEDPVKIHRLFQKILQVLYDKRLIDENETECEDQVQMTSMKAQGTTERPKWRCLRHLVKFLHIRGLRSFQTHAMKIHEHLQTQNWLLELSESVGVEMLQTSNYWGIVRMWKSDNVDTKLLKDVQTFFNQFISDGGIEKLPDIMQSEAKAFSLSFYSEKRLLCKRGGWNGERDADRIRVDIEEPESPLDVWGKLNNLNDVIAWCLDELNETKLSEKNCQMMASNILFLILGYSKDVSFSQEMDEKLINWTRCSKYMGFKSFEIFCYIIERNMKNPNLVQNPLSLIPSWTSWILSIVRYVYEMITRAGTLFSIPKILQRLMLNMTEDLESFKMGEQPERARLFNISFVDLLQGDISYLQDWQLQLISSLSSKQFTPVIALLVECAASNIFEFEQDVAVILDGFNFDANKMKLWNDGLAANMEIFLGFLQKVMVENREKSPERTRTIRRFFGCILRMMQETNMEEVIKANDKNLKEWMTRIFDDLFKFYATANVPVAEEPVNVLVDLSTCVYIQVTFLKLTDEEDDSVEQIKKTREKIQHLLQKIEDVVSSILSNVKDKKPSMKHLPIGFMSREACLNFFSIPRYLLDILDKFLTVQEKVKVEESLKLLVGVVDHLLPSKYKISDEIQGGPIPEGSLSVSNGLDKEARFIAQGYLGDLKEENVEGNPGAQCNFPGYLVKVAEDKYYCSVSWMGDERKMYKYKTFLFDDKSDAIWVPSGDGEVLRHAVEGGRTNLGEIMYIVRVQLDGEWYIGRMKPSQRQAVISYGGGGETFNSYEVLVVSSK